MSQSDDIPDSRSWMPEWLDVVLSDLNHPESNQDRWIYSQASQLDQIKPNQEFQQPNPQVSAEQREGERQTPEVEWVHQDPIVVPVRPSGDRITRRRLRGIHLFMITINGTLGTGLYWRGGQIIELGGPLAVLLSFLLVGIMAWAVMQCITEMLCIWPIPGALSVYVSEFVDMELGIAVGVIYWLTYSISFSALVATSAAEFVFWPVINESKSFQGLVIYFAIPVVLILINALGIGIYRHVEVYTGFLKILFLIIIFVFLIVLKFVALPVQATQEDPSIENWSSVLVVDQSAAPNWATAFIMSISIATFAYVGIEIVAASALEAQWPRRTEFEKLSPSSDKLSHRSKDTLIGKTVKFSAIWISVLATIAYTVTGVLATLEIKWNDCQLPRLSWLKVTNTSNTACYSPPGTSYTNTSSAFVAIAHQSTIAHLADVFNAFLIFTCLSCASTNLYVASRALFGLTSRLDDGREQPWYLRLLAYCGKTDQYGVPRRAMIISAFAFWWVPFLQLRGGTSTTTPIGMFVEILAEMGSVGILLVWACECLAFIRYYHCISNHREALEREGISQVRRWSEKDPDDYPYRGSGQPFLAYAALTGCLFVLVIANGASLWNGFNTMPFLSSYLIVFVFIALWVAMKYIRGGKWSFVDLSNEAKVIRKIKNLHDIRLGAT